MAREIKNIYRGLAEKTRENSSCFNCTPVEIMRDQPKVTRLVYSPRRPGKSCESVDENAKLPKSTKRVTKSSDSSPDNSLLDVREKRKSLQILQPSADGQKLLVAGSSGNRKTKIKKQPKQSKSKQAKLFAPKNDENTDSVSSSSEQEGSKCGNTDGQTTSDEAYALMVQDRAPESYWKLVAEERRKALEETLQENMKLYEMIEELKTENEALREKASHVDYYATLCKVNKISQEQRPPSENQDV